METTHKHECAPENAQRMLDWIRTRGGVAVWQSVNLSNPDASWSTPALTVEGLTAGVPMSRPNWQADTKPARVITDPAEIVVVTRKEVKRFPVGIRMTGIGMVKCSDASSRKIRDAVARAGDGADYEFDYETQQAVITVPAEILPLVAFCERAHTAVPSKPAFVACGVCDQYHPANWTGDCRADAQRFFANELDDKYGHDGWTEVER